MNGIRPPSRPAPPSPPVAVLAQVIPDGVVIADKGNCVYRLSLMLMPDPRPAPETRVAGFALAEWPQWIAKLSQTIVLRNRVTGQTLAVTPPSREALRQRADDATRLWQDIFTADGLLQEDGFLFLAEALLDGQDPTPKPAPELVKSYPVGQVADLVTTIYRGSVAAELLARKEAGSGPAPYGTVLHPSSLRALHDRYLGITSLRRWHASGAARPQHDNNQANSRQKADDTGPTDTTWQDTAKRLLAGAVNPQAETKETAATDLLVKPFAEGLRQLAENDARQAREEFDSWRTAYEEWRRAVARAPSGAPAPAAKARPLTASPTSKGVLPFGDPAFWYEGAAGTDSLRANRAPDETIMPVAAFMVCHLAGALPRADRPAAGDGCDKATFVHFARGKLAGIQAHASLAKYLGLIIDLELSEDQLQRLLGSGYPTDGTPVLCQITAELTGATATLAGEPLYPTACLFEPGRVFRPATRQEAGGPAQPAMPFRGGLLDLSARDANQQPVFELLSLDWAATLHSVINATVSILLRIQNGVIPRFADVSLPEMRARGLALVDRSRRAQALRQMAEQAVDESLPPDLPNLFTADELVVGYRVDVGPVRNLADPPPLAASWRSLTGRIVRYDDFRSNDPWRKPFLDRDHGTIRTSIATRNIAAEGQPQLIVGTAPETLFTWQGESLAVRSRLPEEPEEIRLDPLCALPVGLEYDLPQGNAQALTPALRFGRSYYVGVRLVYANGGGLTLEQAAERYAAGEGVLGAAGGGAFRFLRYESIKGPDVHVAPDDPLARHADPSRRPGELPTTLVVRSGGNNQRRVDRFLVPLRTTFDFCELHGLFDRSSSNTPRGAFRRFRRDREGGFPRIVDAVDGGNRSVPRCSILALDTDGIDSAAPYYPDPMARNCRFAFVRSKRLPLFYDRPVTTSFWKQGEDARAAEPIRLRLVAAARRDETRLGTLRARRVYLGAERINQVEISLAPAEEVELWIWCPPDADDARELLWLADETDGVLASVKQSPAFHEWLEESGAVLPRSNVALGDTPIPTLTPPTVLKLVHAVEKPLAAPCFETRPSGPETARNFVGVRLIQPENTGDRVWHDFISAHRHQDLREWPSQPGASRTFFAGRVLVDRPSTGVLRCEARWQEYDEGPALPRGPNGHYYKPEARLALIFQVDAVLRDDVFPDTPLDLATDEAGLPRNLFFDFPSPAARRLSLRLVATSRFTSYFRADRRAPDTSLGLFEAESTAADVVQDVIWIPNTVPPPAPILDPEILPRFDWEETWNADQTHLVITRTSWWRLHHPTPFHTASGEGTVLAVVCAPSPTFGTIPAPNPGEPMEGEALAHLATRWGTDPRFVSGNLEDAIGTNRFARHDSVVRNVPAPSRADGRPMVEVDLVTYKAAVDPELGRWRFDIEIDPAESYFPWVQLRVCRYQPHSVAGAFLSIPQDIWLRIPPKRTVAVDLLPNRTVAVEVSGIGYTRAGAHGSLSKEQQETLNLPRLEILLLQAVAEDDVPRTSSRDIDWRPVLGPDHSPVVFPVQPVVEGSQLRWSHRFALLGQATRFGLHIREIELASEDSDQPNQARIAEGHSPFRCDVDLGVR